MLLWRTSVCTSDTRALQACTANTYLCALPVCLTSLVPVTQVTGFIGELTALRLLVDCRVLQMVQLPSSPRAARSKEQNPDSDSALSPAWSVISDPDTSEAAQSHQQHADPADTASCFKDSVSTLQFGSRLHHRAREGSSGSAGSDDDLYRAAQLARQLSEHSRS